MPTVSLISFELPITRPVLDARGRVIRNLVELMQPCTYSFAIGHLVYLLTILPGFRFSSSIPWGLRWLLGSTCDPDSLCYSLVHDIIYKTHCLYRVIADKLLDEVAERTGMKNWRSSLIYRGVRYFGDKSWDANLPYISEYAQYVELRIIEVAKQTEV